MKVLQHSGWTLPIDMQTGTKNGGISSTPILRMQATMPQIKAVVKGLRKNTTYNDSTAQTIGGKTLMDKMIKELDGKAGEYHRSFHLPMTFVFSGTQVLHDDGNHTGKTIPGFYMAHYTWGYNYKTLRRVTTYERRHTHYKTGLKDNPHSGRFILTLILGYPSELNITLRGTTKTFHDKEEAEIDCLCEILTDWIVNGVDEYGDYAYNPIDWDSEEYPWNQEAEEELFNQDFGEIEK